MRKERQVGVWAGVLSEKAVHPRLKPCSLVLKVIENGPFLVLLVAPSADQARPQGRPVTRHPASLGSSQPPSLPSSPQGTPSDPEGSPFLPLAASAKGPVYLLPACLSEGWELLQPQPCCLFPSLGLGANRPREVPGHIGTRKASTWGRAGRWRAKEENAPMSSFPGQSFL